LNQSIKEDDEEEVDSDDDFDFPSGFVVVVAVVVSSFSFRGKKCNRVDDVVGFPRGCCGYRSRGELSPRRCVEKDTTENASPTGIINAMMIHT
jgi:hypothetical protein